MNPLAEKLIAEANRLERYQDRGWNDADTNLLREAAKAIDLWVPSVTYSTASTEAQKLQK